MDQGIAHASNMENIHKEVQDICSGISDRFIPEPSQKYSQNDLIGAPRRFNNVVWWEELWQYQKKSTENESSEEIDARLNYKGLNTGLKTTFGFNTAMHGSDNLKSFLSVVDSTPIKEYTQLRRFEIPNSETRYIQSILHNLKKSDTVYVTIEKTNSNRLILVTN